METDPDIRYDTLYAHLSGEEASNTGENFSNENVTPFAKARLLSKMSIWWLNPLTKHGKDKILQENDVPQSRQEDQAQTCYLMFEEKLSKQK